MEFEPRTTDSVTISLTIKITRQVLGPNYGSCLISKLHGAITATRILKSVIDMTTNTNNLVQFRIWNLLQSFSVVKLLSVCCRIESTFRKMSQSDQETGRSFCWNTVQEDDFYLSLNMQGTNCRAFSNIPNFCKGFVFIPLMTPNFLASSRRTVCAWASTQFRQLFGLA